MIMPSALNVLIVGFSMIIFSFLWRMMAARNSDNAWGQAMATIL